MSKRLSLLLLLVVIALGLVACTKVQQGFVGVQRNPDFGLVDGAPRFLEDRRVFGEEYDSDEPWELLPIAVVEPGTIAVTEDGRVLQPGTYAAMAMEEIALVLPKGDFVWSTVPAERLGGCNRYVCETTVVGPSFDGIEVGMDWDVTLEIDLSQNGLLLLEYFSPDPKSALINSIGLVLRDKFTLRSYPFADLYSGSANSQMEEVARANLQALINDQKLPLRVKSVSIRDIEPTDSRIKAAQEELANQLATQAQSAAVVDAQLLQIQAVLDIVEDEAWPVKIAVLQVVFGVPMPEAVEMLNQTPGALPAP